MHTTRIDMSRMSPHARGDAIILIALMETDAELAIQAAFGLALDQLQRVKTLDSEDGRKVVKKTKIQYSPGGDIVGATSEETSLYAEQLATFNGMIESLRKNVHLPLWRMRVAASEA
jgi:hypothetical protein